MAKSGNVEGYMKKIGVEALGESLTLLQISFGVVGWRSICRRLRRGQNGLRKNAICESEILSCLSPNCDGCVWWIRRSGPLNKSPSQWNWTLSFSRQAVPPGTRIRRQRVCVRNWTQGRRCSGMRVRRGFSSRSSPAPPVVSKWMSEEKLVVRHAVFTYMLSESPRCWKGRRKQGYARSHIPVGYLCTSL